VPLHLGLSTKYHRSQKDWVKVLLKRNGYSFFKNIFPLYYVTFVLICLIQMRCKILKSKNIRMTSFIKEILKILYENDEDGFNIINFVCHKMSSTHFFNLYFKI
jgi:hypothetical protein